MTDAEGTISWINPAFTALTGYSSKEAVGQKPSLLKSGEHDEAFYKAKLPALIESLEWTMATRRLTMKKNDDGSLPLNYGWLPGGRVTDYSSGTSTFSRAEHWGRR